MVAPTLREKRRLYTLGAIAASIVGMLVFGGQSPRPAAANIRLPADANEVVAELLGAPQRALTEPRDVRAAARLARIDIELARERSDPRYLGRAQAILAPWTDDTAPAEVLLLRATIEQSLHDFDAALAHLDRALLLDPSDAQAWLTRAVVLTVRGRYEDARESCGHVRGANELAATVCTTQIDSLTGDARRAYEQLSASYTRAKAIGVALSPSELGWIESSLGEYAWRIGDVPSAERHLRSALALAPSDAYARAALADLLLDGARFDEAAQLVAGREVDDGMLLRLAIAERRGGMRGAAEHARILRERVGASRARGDVVHRREESRFWLEIEDDPAKAFELAKANWEVQREPWDVRVFLASAAAMKDPPASALEPVIAWLDRTKLEDPRIARLRRELAR